jgi:hypothetical protein
MYNSNLEMKEKDRAWVILMSCHFVHQSPYKGLRIYDHLPRTRGSVGAMGLCWGSGIHIIVSPAPQEFVLAEAKLVDG